MGDLFHEDVPDEWIDRVFAVMALCPQHTFQVLTKRDKRMRKYVTAKRFDEINSYAGLYGHWSDMPNAGWPLPNVWLGVSVEDQKRADERREHLEQTPAAIKIVSYEPALGPVDWSLWAFVHQIISGGESGVGALPSHPDWHRATRDYCANYSIAYFFKQHGEWIDADEWLQIIQAGPGKILFSGAPWKPSTPLNFKDAQILADMDGFRRSTK